MGRNETKSEISKSEALDAVNERRNRTSDSGLSALPTHLRNDSNEGSTRRSVLKKSGIGAFGFGTLTKKLGLSTFDRSTRIVTTRAGLKSEAVSTKKVPMKWLEHQRTVRKVTDRLRQVWEDVPFVGSVAYVPSNRMDEGVYYGQPEISVRPEATDEQIATLPESLEDSQLQVPSKLKVSDIAVRRMNGEFTLGDVDCYDEVTDSPFPGGLKIKNDNDGSYSMGTAGFMVFDDTAEYLYTANHVMKKCDCCVPSTNAYDENDNYLGSVVDGHKNHDWCVIERSGGGYGNTIQYEENEIELHGWVTENGIDNLQGNTNAIRQQGVISGYQTGTLKGDQASFGNGNCASMVGNAVKLGFPDYAREGDSGGPYWWPNSDGNFAITVHAGFEEFDGTYSGCGHSGEKGNPAYGYPVWRVFNNTNYAIS